MDDIRLLLGRNIKEIRKKLGLSQEGLCEKSRVDRGYLSDIERGKRWPSPEVLKAIAKALKTPTMNLFRKAGAMVTKEEALAIIAKSAGIEVNSVITAVEAHPKSKALQDAIGLLSTLDDNEVAFLMRNIPFFIAGLNGAPNPIRTPKTPKEKKKVGV